MTNSTSFLDKCKGIALVFGAFSLILFGAAALIYSSAPAKAAQPNTTYATGKYQMQMNAVLNDASTMYFYVLVWDTETGYSKMYYGSDKLGKITTAGSAFNLPSSPL